MNNSDSIKYLEGMIEKNEKRIEKLRLKIRLIKELDNDRNCMVCGGVFKPKKLGQVYCCDKCARFGSELFSRNVERRNELSRKYHRKNMQALKEANK